MKRRKFKPAVLLFVGLVSFLWIDLLHAQIQITERNVDVEKFLGLIPRKAALTVSWTFSGQQDQLPSKYQVLYRMGKGNLYLSHEVLPSSTGEATWTFPPVHMGDTLFTKILAVGERSDTLDSLQFIYAPGKVYAKGPSSSGFSFSSLFTGRLLLMLVGRSEIYDDSTGLGKVAFALEYYLLVMGLFLFFFQTIPNLRFFDVRKKVYDEIIKIVRDWENVIRSIHDQISGGKRENSRGEESRFLEWWNNTGYKSLTGVKNSLEKINSEKGKKRKPGIFSFIRHIYDSFKEIRRILTGNATQKHVKQTIGLPVVNVLYAGVQNHLANGHLGVQASEEIDRAMENRAESELSQVEDLSKVEWLWTIASLAPLVGLFGTVTGLSQSFERLASFAQEGSGMIQQLSKGIFEALWTTIFGLGIGILFSFCYYWARNRIDHAYSKLQDIYVSISEKL